MSKPFKRLTSVNECRVLQVIEVKAITGEGTDDDPVIEVTEYYSFEGDLLARKTPMDNLVAGVWASVPNLTKEK